MKPSKILLFIILSLIASCKSHKTTTESTYTLSDTLTSQTNLQLHSKIEIQKAESISTRQSQNRIEFQDQNGEIQILPDGKVTIKGLKSAELNNQSLQKISKATDSSSDTISIFSYEQSASKVVDVKASKAAPHSYPSLWIFLYSLILITIILLTVYKSISKWHK